METYGADRNAVVTSGNSSATVVNLAAARRGRCGVLLYNSSTQVLYVKLGAAASATDYTYPMASNTSWEVPFGYTGLITGVWASANGSVKVTEVF